LNFTVCTYENLSAYVPLGRDLAADHDAWLTFGQKKLEDETVICDIWGAVCVRFHAWLHDVVLPAGTTSERCWYYVYTAAQPRTCFVDHINASDFLRNDKPWAVPYTATELLHGKLIALRHCMYKKAF